jgi:predicted permease
LIFGVLPAIRATRVDLLTPLKDGGRTATGGRALVDRGIVAAQVALALVLVCGATLFVTTLRNLERFDEGTDASHVLLAGIDTRGTIYSARGMMAIYPELLASVRALPGVTSAAMSTSAPVFGGRSLRDGIHVPGFEPTDDSDRSASFAGVTPEFFSTTGVAIERGRAFDVGDADGAEPVAIVTRAFAKHYFPARDPIGGSIVLGEGPAAKSMRIVGVSRDARYDDMRAPPPEMYYAPLAQTGEIPLLVLSVRSAGDPALLAPSVRRELDRIAPGIRVVRLISFEQAMNSELARERLAAGLAALFGAFALALAAIGIYGVVAYSVTRRTAEIGIRMALGARPADALWLVVRQTMVITVIGVAVGVPLAFLAARAIGAQLYGIGATDPRAMIGAVAILGVAGAVASVVPGRRAARIDPVEALRGE